jgi:hypothetical protein
MSAFNTDPSKLWGTSLGLLMEFRADPMFNAADSLVFLYLEKKFLYSCFNLTILKDGLKLLF